MDVLHKDIWYALKNETDGFAATTLKPSETGLPAYIIVNCYGSYNCAIKPKKHRTMIVEISKNSPINWSETIPVEVSETPKILLKAKKLKQALALFSKEEWENIFYYVMQNRYAIKRHWAGETDSFGLMNEVKNIGS